jgi:hypothetical protein
MAEDSKAAPAAAPAGASNVPKYVAGAGAVALLAALISYFLLGKCKSECDSLTKDMHVSEAWKNLKAAASSAPKEFVNAFFTEISPTNCGITDDPTVDPN